MIKMARVWREVRKDLIERGLIDTEKAAYARALLEHDVKVYDDEAYDEYNSGCRRSRQGHECIICDHKECGWCPDCLYAPEWTLL
jgi:hypothetical protein